MEYEYLDVTVPESQIEDTKIQQQANGWEFLRQVKVREHVEPDADYRMALSFRRPKSQ